MPKKINPRRKPASHADVDRAWSEGCIEGMRLAEAIFLTVLADKHSHEINLQQVWDEIVDKTEAMDQGYFTGADMRQALKDDYGIELLTGPSKAIAHSRGVTRHALSKMRQ